MKGNRQGAPSRSIKVKFQTFLKFEICRQLVKNFFDKLKQVFLANTCFLVLQRKIVFLIFGKIQRLRTGRNTLERIITELTAGRIHGNHALLGAKHILLIHFGAVDAVDAATLDFFSEQHDDNLPYGLYYTPSFSEMLLLFCGYTGKEGIKTKWTKIYLIQSR